MSDSTLTHHGATYPALAAGFSARMVVSRSTITDNASVAFYQYNSGVFESRGDNAVRNNNAGGIQTVGTITPLAGM